jgi:hypothetical protein
MLLHVKTLKIWNWSAGKSDARHLVMQVGLHRAGDLSVARWVTNNDMSPLPRLAHRADASGAILHG